MRTIQFYGDSRKRGWALGAFPEEISSSHPLYLFRSPKSMIESACADSGIAVQVVERTYLNDANAVLDAAALSLNPGDAVVVEDAGEHDYAPIYSDPDNYQAMWQGVLGAFVAPSSAMPTTPAQLTAFILNTVAGGVQICAETTPDYTSLVNCQYDVVFSGKTRTMNDAIRAAAASKGAKVIDTNALIDQWKSDLYGEQLVPVMHPDGIHENVWGQAMRCGGILKALGITVTNTSTLSNLAENNIGTLRYGSPYLQSGKAALNMYHCLRGETGRW